MFDGNNEISNKLLSLKHWRQVFGWPGRPILESSIKWGPCLAYTYSRVICIGVLVAWEKLSCNKTHTHIGCWLPNFFSFYQILVLKWRLTTSGLRFPLISIDLFNKCCAWLIYNFKISKIDQNKISAGYIFIMAPTWKSHVFLNFISKGDLSPLNTEGCRCQTQTT